MSSWGDIARLASRLRDPITIEELELASDGLGGNTENWETFATTYAQVEPIFGSAREQVIAAQREAREAFKITLRRRDGVTSAMRVQWQGKTLNIHGVTSTRSTTEIIAYAGGEA